MYLPPELYFKILEFADNSDILTIAVLSKYHNEIVRDYIELNIPRFITSAKIAVKYMDRKKIVDNKTFKDLLPTIDSIINNNEDLYILMNNDFIWPIIVSYFTSTLEINKAPVVPLILPSFFPWLLKETYNKIKKEEGNISRWLPLILILEPIEVKKDDDGNLEIVESKSMRPKNYGTAECILSACPELTMDLLSMDDTKRQAFEKDICRFIMSTPMYIPKTPKDDTELLYGNILCNAAKTLLSIITQGKSTIIKETLENKIYEYIEKELNNLQYATENNLIINPIIYLSI